MIQPILYKRKENFAFAEKGLAKMPDDSITWIYKASKGQEINAAHVQLAMSMASVYTTSDLFSSIVLRLFRGPEWIKPLVDEADTVLGEGGYEKQSLYQMRLADSLIKETQRVTPLGVCE